MAIDIDDPYGNNPYAVPLPPDTTGDPKWEKQPVEESLDFLTRKDDLPGRLRRSGNLG